ncbi:MAG: hypothetical protein HZA11_09225 [Nitrospirae bacterium]|nr:hypothetical protein [Nitrospirota bacterium]
MGEGKNLIKKEVFLFLSIVIIGIMIFACSAPSNPKLSDKELLVNFYREILQKADVADKAYKPFGEAMGKSKWMEATIAAQKALPIIDTQGREILYIKVPAFQNDTVEKELNEAKNLIVSAYAHKVNIISQYLEFTKEPSSLIYRAAEIKNSGESSQSQAMMGIFKIIGAGSELGLKPGEIMGEITKALPGEYVAKKIDDKIGIVYGYSIVKTTIKKENVEPTLQNALTAAKRLYPNYFRFKIWLIKDEFAKIDKAYGCLDYINEKTTILTLRADN